MQVVKNYKTVLYTIVVAELAFVFDKGVAFLYLSFFKETTRLFENKRKVYKRVEGY